MSVIILSSHATHLDCSRVGTHIYTLSTKIITFIEEDWPSLHVVSWKPPLRFQSSELWQITMKVHGFWNMLNDLKGKWKGSLKFGQGWELHNLGLRYIKYKTYFWKSLHIKYYYIKFRIWKKCHFSSPPVAKFMLLKLQLNFAML